MTLSPVEPVSGTPFGVRFVEALVAEPRAVLDTLPEAVVQHAWARTLFDRSELRTTEGDVVRVEHPGRLNRASGPDFSGARVTIDGLAWAGDVEIHRTSTDWERHGHHVDPAYDRVVLHVVLSADARTGTLRRADGSPLPELVLLPHLDRSLAAVVRDLAAAPDAAPRCRTRWADVPGDLARETVQTLGAARLRQKAQALGRAYGRRPDLDALLVGRTFRALGYADNADAMETLSARLPRHALRSLDDSSDVLALLLGTAGYVPSLVEDDLTRRWARVAPPGLIPMPPEAWRRSGRPANAPRRRIAQAAALVAPGGVLRRDAASQLAAALDSGADVLLDLLRPHPADATPRLGADRARDAFVNAVAPVLLLDADLRSDPRLEALVFAAVAAMPAARDHITDGFRDAGLPLRGALEAQGAHALARDFCDEGRCARCAIGLHLWPGLAAG